MLCNTLTWDGNKAHWMYCSGLPYVGGSSISPSPGSSFLTLCSHFPWGLCPENAPGATFPPTVFFPSSLQMRNVPVPYGTLLSYYTPPVLHCRGSWVLIQGQQLFWQITTWRASFSIRKGKVEKRERECARETSSTKVFWHTWSSNVNFWKLHELWMLRCFRGIHSLDNVLRLMSAQANKAMLPEAFKELGKLLWNWETQLIEGKIAVSSFSVCLDFLAELCFLLLCRHGGSRSHVS